MHVHIVLKYDTVCLGLAVADLEKQVGADANGRKYGLACNSGSTPTLRHFRLHVGDLGVVCK